MTALPQQQGQGGHLPKRRGFALRVSRSRVSSGTKKWQEGVGRGAGGIYIEGLSVAVSINVKIIMYLKQGRMWKGVAKGGVKLGCQFLCE